MTNRFAIVAACLIGFWASVPGYSEARAAAPQIAGTSGLVGRWQSPDSVVQINADGTLTVNAVQYRYSVQANTLTLIGIDGSVPVPFKLAGDTLMVSLNGQLITMQRIRAGQPTPGGGAAGSGGPGATAAELAGKWCYVSNFTANAGGRVSDECITIAQDGTYRYHRETSSSGQYGSTASSQDDYGTWRLEGGALAVSSRTQGPATYPLTKRNHPKTNDPMICLDGRCFVTYGPKPPWR